MNFNIIKILKDFIADSRRVIDISYKPDMDTFKRTMKIVLIGTLILGALGFVIEFIVTYIT